MSGSAAPIALTITAVDQTAKTIDAINARMAAFGKRTQASVERATAPVRSLGNALKTFGDVSSLNRVGAAFGSLARAGNDAYQKVGQVIPLLGIVGSAATVAGITRMVTAWSEWGSRVGFTAQRIGISASRLSAFQGAAQLAGASAQGAANGLQTLGQTMYDAIGGRAPEAIKMFRTLGIAFQDASGHARSVTEVLPEVADKIRAIRDPFAQAQVATTLFGGAAEDLLPFLRQGSAGIREYLETARRYGAVSDASAAAANRLREAQARVSLATEGLRNRIAERLEPILTPLLTHFAEWIATSPQVARGVEWLGAKVGELGSYLSNVDWASVQQTWEGWGATIGNVATALGGPQKVIEGLMLLMGASFALKVITPFLTLGGAIVGATFKLSALSAGMAGMTGKSLLTTMLGRGAGLAGGLGLAGLAWEGANLAQDATQPAGDGFANLLHNMIFDMNPTHWTQSYHPGQGGGGKSGGQTNTFDTNLTPQARGLLDTIAAGEARSYQSLYGDSASHPNQFSDNSRFPQWGGAMVNGQPTHAAGRYQFEPATWAEAAAATGHLDMSPASQDQNAWWLAQRDYKKRTGRLLADDMKSNDPAVRSQIGNVLQPTWTSASGRRFAQELQPNIDRENLAVPSAQGAPMALASGGQNGGSGKDSNVRLQIDGRMDKGMSMSVASAQGATVSGPLVERPQLLGANP